MEGGRRFKVSWGGFVQLVGAPKAAPRCSIRLEVINYEQPTQYCSVPQKGSENPPKTGRMSAILLKYTTSAIHY